MSEYKAICIYIYTHTRFLNDNSNIKSPARYDQRVESRIIVIYVYIDMYSDIERTAILSSQWKN